MSFHVTAEGLWTTITPENGAQEDAGNGLSRAETESETIASNWPLKRLVAI